MYVRRAAFRRRDPRERERERERESETIFRKQPCTHVGTRRCVPTTARKTKQLNAKEGNVRVILRHRVVGRLFPRIGNKSQPRWLKLPTAREEAGGNG